MPLADTLADVFLVMGQSQLIQFSFRLKVDDFEFLAAMLEAVAQDIDKTLHINCVLKGLIKFLLWIALAAFFKQCPLYWLSILDKGTQRFNIQCVVFRKNSGVIILKSRAIPYVCGFLPAAFGRNQRILYPVQIVFRYLALLHLPNVYIADSDKCFSHFNIPAFSRSQPHK